MTEPSAPASDRELSSPATNESRIRVRIDDLAFVAAEALAWPVTALLGATTPVLRRLEATGGHSLAEQLRIQEPLPVGSAVVTTGGGLEVELLVSAVVSSDSEAVSRAGVRRAMTSALQRAADWQIEGLVCAPFGLGAGNLEVEDSASIMIEAIAAHWSRARFPVSIELIVENEREEEAFRDAMARCTGRGGP
jgi:O-acetyl-ADP-ribose deacetylase (regulator of RNase III)